MDRISKIQTITADKTLLLFFFRINFKKGGGYKCPVVYTRILNVSSTINPSIVEQFWNFIYLFERVHYSGFVTKSGYNDGIPWIIEEILKFCD